MENELIYIILHFVVCFAFFQLIQRPMFMIYNRSANSENMTIKDFFQIYRYGCRSDLIAASFITAFPVLLLWLHSHFPRFDTFMPLVCYDILLAVALGLLTVSDTALYKFWKFKIDSSVLEYLHSPKGVFASVSGLYVFIAFSSAGLVSALFFCGVVWCARIFSPGKSDLVPEIMDHVIVFVCFLLIAGLLFAAIRGVGSRPNNPYVSFFSKNPYYNHCALNPLYNMIYSFTVKQDKYYKQFQIFDKEECRKKFEPLFPLNGKPKLKLLNTSRPNVLFIVWESLCSKYVESLGGRPDVTPNIERLSKEGAFFSQCYAGSFRTDRGLVCLLSGYLGLPTTSVMANIKKLPNMPALPRVFKDLGYKTMAVHGGDLSIRHKREYYWIIGHDDLMAQEDFPKDAPTGKWGCHDDYVFSWLYDDIIKKTQNKEQWYTTFQTLSSHENWKVPYNRLPQDEVANSFAYVDDSFGKFVDKLKASPAWDNLLIICTGDHGVNLEQSVERAENSHLPLLMLGGAVEKGVQIDTLMSQSDIAATLLGQMGLPHEEFVFSRDVLADTYTYPFAFHAYFNGFIFRDETGITDYDNDAGTAITGADERREELGKVILQELYGDLSRR